MTLWLSLLVVLGLAVAGAVPGAAQDVGPGSLPEGLTADGWQAIQDQIARLTASDGAQGGQFGDSVTVYGNTAVVGTPWAMVGGNLYQGAAYVFYRNRGGPDAWGQVAKLTAADGTVWDHFGWSVALDNNTLVVGCPLATIGGNEWQGKAYIFYRNQGGPDAWGQVARLTAADGGDGDRFGSSVAVDGDTVLIGAVYASPGGMVARGAAYVLYRDQGGPNAWGQAAKLMAAYGQSGDYFAWSVFLDGDTALIGAPKARGRHSLGAAYVFYRHQGGPNTWGQVVKISAAEGGQQDWFGSSVSVSGDTALVGAPRAWIGGKEHQGAAYVFSRNRGGPDAWGEVTQLTAADGAKQAGFGYSVSVYGEVAVVGAPYPIEFGRNDEQGRAYVLYQNQGGPEAWGQVARLIPADGTADDWFGASVSVRAGTVLAGAPFAYVGDIRPGVAYIFSLPTAFLHLSGMAIAWQAGTEPGTYIITAAVDVHDQDHAPVSGVTVYANCTGPSGKTVHKTAVTGLQGQAKFRLKGKEAGTYEFCIGDMAKAGYGYTPDENEVPACTTIVVGGR